MLYIKTKIMKQQKFFATYSTDFMKMRFFVLILAWSILFPAFVNAQNARVKVIDGDSLMVDGVEVRLSGIDAPEYHQECYDKDNKPYPCGKMAYEFLLKITGQDTVCKQIVKDKYHRSVAVCRSQGKNLNQEMVANGWAVAYTSYTDAFLDTEAKAKKAGRGIWQGRFMRPELYRALMRKK